VVTARSAERKADALAVEVRAEPAAPMRKELGKLVKRRHARVKTAFKRATSALLPVLAKGTTAS
jgi:hypothetical protein